MTHRTQDNITEELAAIMIILDLDRLPTRDEIKLVTGSEALDHAIKRHGGRAYYTKRLKTHSKNERDGFKKRVQPCRVCGRALIWFSREQMVNGVCVNCGNGVFNYDSLQEAIDGWNCANKVKEEE